MTTESTERRYLRAAIKTPVGTLAVILGESGSIYRIAHGEITDDSFGDFNDMRWAAARQICDVERQFAEYFAGTRSAFSLRLVLRGSDFQRSVWNQLTMIPYGESSSYSAIARRIGRPLAARAVGNAVGSNPITIVIPCHRVLPITGVVGNYAVRRLGDRGRTIKQRLLRLEGVL